MWSSSGAGQHSRLFFPSRAPRQCRGAAALAGTSGFSGGYFTGGCIASFSGAITGLVVGSGSPSGVDHLVRGLVAVGHLLQPAALDGGQHHRQGRADGHRSEGDRFFRGGHGGWAARPRTAPCRATAFPHPAHRSPNWGCHDGRPRRSPPGNPWPEADCAFGCSTFPAKGIVEARYVAERPPALGDRAVALLAPRPGDRGLCAPGLPALRDRGADLEPLL